MLMRTSINFKRFASEAFLSASQGALGRHERTDTDFSLKKESFALFKRLHYHGLKKRSRLDFF